jgi:nitroreductase
MEFDEVVRRRRSVRIFDRREVPDNVLRDVIGCALQAPSSMNGQPWYFVLVRSPETKQRLSEIKDEYCPPEKRMYPASFLQEAPVIVVTCVERERSFDRGLESGVLATGHLLLAAADRGLAGVYLSAYKADTPQVADDIRALLRLPPDVDPITIVPIGYPGSCPEPKVLRPVEEVIFHEAFGER